MNLHIFSDGLGHYLCETFDRIERLQPENNHYINLVENVKYKRDKIFYTRFDKVSTLNYINSLQNIERVYFHFYTHLSAFILKDLKASNPKLIAVWVFWSADFYHLPKFVPSLYLDYSKHFLPKTFYPKIVRRGLSNLKSIIIKRPIFNHKKFIESFNLLDYFATILKHDYDNVIEYSKSNMRYVLFAYLSYEQMIDFDIESCVSMGNKIMINHSADPTLNHYEILMSLKGREINQGVFLPLAYGNEKYKNKLSEIAKKWFKEVEIQTDFIDKKEYNKRLLGVGFAIFNSKIQQAMGNIIILLWYGVKIFLREENSVYQEFKEWKLLVYSVQKDLPNESFNLKLSPEQIEHNRNILRQKLSSEKVDEYYNRLMTIS